MRIHIVHTAGGAPYRSPTKARSATHPVTIHRIFVDARSRCADARHAQWTVGVMRIATASVASVSQAGHRRGRGGAGFGVSVMGSARGWIDLFHPHSVMSAVPPTEIRARAEFASAVTDAESSRPFARMIRCRLGFLSSPPPPAGGIFILATTADRQLPFDTELSGASGFQLFRAGVVSTVASGFHAKGGHHVPHSSRHSGPGAPGVPS